MRRPPGQTAFLVLVWLAALGVSLVQYHRILRAFFIIDDFVWLSCARESQEHLGHVFNLHISNFFRPLAHLYFAAVHAAFGANEIAHHVGNLVLHAFCATLLVQLTFRLCGRRWPAMLAGAVFLLTPLYADAVVWVSAVTEPVFAAAALGTLLLWRRLWERPGGSVLTLVAAFAGFAATLGAKESAVSFIGLLMLLHLGLHLRGRSRRGGLWIYLPFVVLQLGYMAFQYRVQQQSYLVRDGIFALGAHGALAMSVSLGRLLANTLPVYVAAGAGLVLLRHRPAMRAGAPTGALLLLGLVVAMAPTSMFGGGGLSSRYLYLPALLASLAAALCAGPVLARLSRRTGTLLLLGALLVLALNGHRFAANAESRYLAVAGSMRRFVGELGRLPRLGTPLLLLDSPLCGQQLLGALTLFQPELAAAQPVRCVESRRHLPLRFRPRSVWRWDPVSAAFRAIEPAASPPLLPGANR